MEPLTAAVGEKEATNKEKKTCINIEIMSAIHVTAMAASPKTRCFFPSAPLSVSLSLSCLGSVCCSVCGRGLTSCLPWLWLLCTPVCNQLIPPAALHASLSSVRQPAVSPPRLSNCSSSDCCFNPVVCTHQGQCKLLVELISPLVFFFFSCV